MLSLAFGGLAQLVGRNRVRWQWLVAAIGFFIGGLIASEALWADPTLDLEPIVDGLSVDEALLGDVIDHHVHGRHRDEVERPGRWPRRSRAWRQSVWTA